MHPLRLQARAAPSAAAARPACLCGPRPSCRRRQLPVARYGSGPRIPEPQDVAASVTLVPRQQSSLARHASVEDDPTGVKAFLLKCRLAWNLFFPPNEEAPNLSPKDVGKQRLSMILVADRCGLSPHSLVEMKRNTIAALSGCMDMEELQDAHLRFTMTREGGTTYSMAVPILRPGPYADDGSVVGQAGGGASHASLDSLDEWEHEPEQASQQDGCFEDEGEVLDVQLEPEQVWQPQASAAAGVQPPHEEAGAGPPPSLEQAAARWATAPEPVPVAAASAGPALDAAAAAAAAVAVATWPRSSSRQQQQHIISTDPQAAQLESAVDMAAAQQELRELLVEELVHDVQGLAASTAEAALSAQLEAAVDEVQHLGEPGAITRSGGEGAA